MLRARFPLVMDDSFKIKQKTLETRNIPYISLEKILMETFVKISALAHRNGMLLEGIKAFPEPMLNKITTFKSVVWRERA